MAPKRPRKPQHRQSYERFVPALLKELREAAGLTQRELAKKLDCPQITVHRMEVNTRRADICELFQWAKACDANPKKVFLRILDDIK